MTKVNLKKLLPYLPIIAIWLIAFFLRIYRQDDLLGFYYDQGRDAKMADDIIHGRNFPAIGPTTGISGLFLGPLWYYFIVPGYLLGQGDPALASIFVTFIESLSVPLIYLLLSKYWNKQSAYLGAIFWGFSNYLIRSSRWFSNPSPLPFFVLIEIYLLTVLFKDKKTKLLPWIAFVLSICLQLEAASAVFFIPVIIFLSILNFSIIKKIPILTWIKSALSFSVLFLPLLAFELKNKFLITNNFFGFLTGRINSDTGKSWGIPTIEFLQKRLFTYYQAFFSKVDTNYGKLSFVFLIVFIIGLIYILKKHSKNKFIQVTSAWLIIPLIFLLFFVGNYGTLYDYYLTGFFPAFILLFSVVLSISKNRILSTFIALLSLMYFFNGNYIHLKNYLIAGVDGPTNIMLGNERQAVDYICTQTKGKQYNLDIYVPPVITHSYDYLFSKRFENNTCDKAQAQPTDLMYAFFEVDPPHPERLEEWFKRFQNSKMVKEVKFGGITVQERQRINN